MSMSRKQEKSDLRHDLGTLFLIIFTHIRSSLLQWDETRRVGGTNTWSTVSNWLVGD